MAQRKRKSTKKVNTKKKTIKKRAVKKTITKKRTTKKRTAKRTITKRKTPKKGKAKKTTLKGKSTKRTSRGSAQHVRAIASEIKRLSAIFVKHGEDAVEDEVDMLEDKIKELVRGQKISEEQAIKLGDELDELDD